MGQILGQLGRLFVEAVPTMLFVLALLAILNWLFFKPLTKVLEQRHAASKGAIEKAGLDRQGASEKLCQYEAAIDRARRELYQQRDADRQSLLAERDTLLKKAREQAESSLKSAQAELAKQVEAAKRDLGGAIQAVASEIVGKIMGEGPASGPAAKPGA